MNKPGRNDPCYCNSGKKYKKCCMDKDNGDNHAEVSVTPEAYLEQQDWGFYAYRTVASLFLKKVKGEYDNKPIMEALALWRRFSADTEPVIRKYGSYAAALEYMIVTMYGHEATQAHVAKKYDVSTATLSRTYQVLYDFALNFEEGSPRAPLAVDPRIGMEQDMRNLERLLGEQQFDSFEEAQAFLDKQINQPGGFRPPAATKVSVKDQAQDLVYKAYEETTAKNRVKLAKQALSLYPNSAEAYLILADEERMLEQSLDYLRRGVDAGEKDLGAAFFKQNKGHFWGLIETRPYMRVKYRLAEILWYSGEAEEASKHLEQMMELSTGDNLGARYLLLPALLSLKKIREASKLLLKYGDDSAANIAYDRFVMEYVNNGFTRRLDELYRAALQINKFVPEYLTGKKKLPQQLPDYVGHGDRNEAIDYAFTHSPLWSRMPELVEWIAKRER